MAEKSFLENLFNAPRDFTSEMGKLKEKLMPKKDTGAEAARRAEQARARAELEAEDRRRADARAAEIRAEVDDLFRGPSLSERGARVVSQPDRSYQPISLDRQRLLQRRQMYLELVQSAKDPSRKRQAEADLIRTDEELRRVA